VLSEIAGKPQKPVAKPAPVVDREATVVEEQLEQTFDA